MPLSEAERELLHGSPEDGVPAHRGGITPSQHNKHYLSGNEKTLDAFHPVIEGVGGGYVGVGTEQAYVFIAWARSEIAWLIDYDPAVQEIHELYRLFFRVSSTPAELVALWSGDGRERAYALIDAEHGKARAKRLRYWYRNSRARIDRRLRRVNRRLAEVQVPSVFADQEPYDYVRAMLEHKRIRPMLANLLATEGLAGIGRSARSLGVPVRLLYLSNAEQYWKRYAPQFRRNVAALPYADDAVVMRTLLSQEANEDYRYNVQPAANYLEWLGQPFIGNVYHIVHERPPAPPGVVTMFETNQDPADSPAGKRYRARQEQGSGKRR